MSNALYFVVRCKDGEAYRRNGMFYGRSALRAFKLLNAAKGNAIALAKYHRENMRVDNAEGETVLTINENGEEVK